MVYTGFDRDLEFDIDFISKGQITKWVIYISLIIDFRSYVSIVSIYVMVYSGFGDADKFDLDVISQGQITKWAISRLLSSLELMFQL